MFKKFLSNVKAIGGGGTALIIFGIMVAVFLMIWGSIGSTAVITASNTTALTDASVPASTIAMYALIVVIALVAIIIAVLKSATKGR